MFLRAVLVCFSILAAKGRLGCPNGRLGGPNGSLQMLKLMILELSRRVFGADWACFFVSRRVFGAGCACFFGLDVEGRPICPNSFLWIGLEVCGRVLSCVFL